MVFLWVGLGVQGIFRVFGDLASQPCIWIASSAGHLLQLRHFSNKILWMVFLFLDENICFGYSLEVSQQGTSNAYPHHIFLCRNLKNNFWIFPFWSFAVTLLDEVLHRWTNQGPFVQGIISLTSSLVVKILTVPVSTVSSSQGIFFFFAGKI